MYPLSGRTADEAWRLAAAAFFSPKGSAEQQSGRGGATSELLHVMFEIDDPRQRWVVSRTPPINPAFAMVEVFWIVAGRGDSELPRFWNPSLARFCGDTAVLSGAYGYRLRSHFGVDQLDLVYQTLDSSPDSRQAVLQIWDPQTDLPRNRGVPMRDDIPCNVIAMPKVRRGRLEWLQIMRSNDMFRGLPYNIVQFTSLQEMLAGWLGIDLGKYHHVSDSLHVYENDIGRVQESLEPALLPASSANFALPRREWDRVVADVVRRLECMIGDDLTEPVLRNAAFYSDVPEAYENAVRIAGADAARRRGWLELATECAARCDDPTLQTLWRRWASRFPAASGGLASVSPRPQSAGKGRAT